MNALLVDPDHQRGNRLRLGLAARGFLVEHTVDPFYALSLSERTKLETLFVSASLSAAEYQILVDTLLADPDQSGIRIGVLHAAPALSSALPDRVAACADEDESRMLGWMAAKLERAQQANAGVVSGGWLSRQNRDVALIGTFEATSFPDLLQLASASSGSGTILIRGPRGEAKVLLREGVVERVIYAGWVDVEAAAWLIRDTEAVPSTQFRRTHATEDVAMPLGMHATELLLQASTYLDGRDRNSAQGRRS